MRSPPDSRSSTHSLQFPQLTTKRQIEVVKCRAQAESIGVDGKKTKMGSFKIAQMIAKKDGLRGFYIGGLMTACRDGISSGIFFWGCSSSLLLAYRGETDEDADFVFRRLLRGQEPFQPTPRTTIPGMEASKDTPTIPPISEIITEGKINKAEVARILLAGGMAGSLSAIVPYPYVLIWSYRHDLADEAVDSTLSKLVYKPRRSSLARILSSRQRYSLPPSPRAPPRLFHRQ